MIAGGCKKDLREFASAMGEDTRHALAKVHGKVNMLAAEASATIARSIDKIPTIDVTSAGVVRLQDEFSKSTENMLSIVENGLSNILSSVIPTKPLSASLYPHATATTQSGPLL